MQVGAHMYSRMISAHRANDRIQLWTKGVYVGIEKDWPDKQGGVLGKVDHAAYYTLYSGWDSVGYIERHRVNEGRAGRV